MNQPQQQKPPHPIVLYRQQIEQRIMEFAKVLPPSIRPDEFARVALTAATTNPDLLWADRHSLLTSLMRAAEDHLLPDGREGALVVFKTKKMIDGKEEWVKAVQWLPMVEGVRKRLLVEGGIVLNTGVVYEDDFWEYERGDEPRIKHMPRPGPRSREKLVAVYSIARDHKGHIIDRDWMWRAEIDQIRHEYSRSANSPAWTKDTSYPEMALKTVIHHQAKTLPISPEFRSMVGRPEFLDTSAVEASRATESDLPAHEPGPDLLASPGAYQQPIDPQPRTVGGILDALGTGETVEKPTRRGRRTNAEIKVDNERQAQAAAAQQAGSGGAPGQYGGGAAGNGQGGGVYQPGSGPSSTNQAFSGGGGASTQGASDIGMVTTRVPYTETFDPQTGEVTASYDQPQSEPEPNPDGLDIPASLRRTEPTVEDEYRMLIVQPHPTNRLEYVAWFETRWKDYAPTDAKKEALKQWWANTGGMRAQFGVNKDDIEKLKLAMATPQQGAQS